MLRKLKNRRQGFSLMELLLVIGIIVVLVGAIGSMWWVSREHAKETVAHEEVARIQESLWKAVGNGEITWDQIPDTATAVKDLPAAVKSCLAFGGDPDRAKDFLDPWGAPYMVQRNGQPQP